MNHQRMFWLLLVAGAIWSVVMFWQGSEFKKRDCSTERGDARQACEHTSPFAALELATDPPTFRDRIDQGDPKANELWNTEIARANTYMDFLFIALYWGVFLLFARLQSRWAFVLVAVFISLVAALDIAENVRLLQALHGVISCESQFPVPGFVSELKWGLFAIATCVLGIALAVSKKLWPIVMSILMVGSAGLTAVGISQITLLAPAILLLFTSFVIAIFYYFPFGPFSWELSQWFQYLYFLRFSLLASLFPVFLIYLDYYTGAAGLTRGIMTVESLWQAFFAAFFVVAFQMTALITARNIVKNGEDRFLSAPPSFLHTLLTCVKAKTMWWVLVLAHIPTSVALIYLGYNAWREESTHYAWIFWIFLALGVAAALIFWYLVSLFYMWTYKPNGVVAPAALIFPGKLFGDTAKAKRPPRIKKLESLALFFLKKSCSGYAASAKGPLWELHFLSALALFGFLSLYLLLYPFTAPIFQPRLFGLGVALGPLLLVLIVGIFVSIIWGADTAGSKWAPWVKYGFGTIPVGLIVSYGVGIAYGYVNGRNLLEMAFPTLASILVIATFMLWFLSALGFFFDRYRVPVLIILFLVFFLPRIFLKHWSQAEHYYSVEQLSSPAYPPSPAEVLQVRSKNLDKPDIIVTAAGGGIHAAAWTSQVMSRLETSFANDQVLKGKSYTFHDHIILASGVSGGSVGLMPYLLEYAATDESGFQNLINSQFHTRITSPSSCSSLEAVAWGLEYYDLYRLLFDAGWEKKREVLDRSWALSTAFGRNLHDPHCFDGGPPPPADSGRDSLTLSKASHLLCSGKMPAFTFNTTAAETGDRFLLSNYEVPPPRSKDSDFVPAQSFLQVYAQESPLKTLKKYADLHLTTAARLSATFPYVSSASRLRVDYADHAYHFLDGGYFDNDGTASVIEFLKSALDGSRATSKTSSPPQALTAHRRRILLIEIRDGADLDSQSDDDLSHQDQNGYSKWTALNQLIAPPNGLWKAGHSGISRRNRRELCLLETSYRQDLNIHHLVFPIETSTSRTQPLSWNLTANQRNDINSWASDKTKTGARIDEAVRWVRAALSGEITDADSDADICKTAEVPYVAEK